MREAVYRALAHPSERRSWAIIGKRHPLPRRRCDGRGLLPEARRDCSRRSTRRTAPAGTGSGTSRRSQALRSDRRTTGQEPGSPQPADGTRLVVEKPFGNDLKPPGELNSARTYFDESQIFRIDHYLGKETVQNLLVFRFANEIFEPLWNRRYVDHVQITSPRHRRSRRAARSTRRRARFATSPRTISCNCSTLTAMEPPMAWAADDIRTEKVQVLRAVRRWIDPGVRRRHCPRPVRGIS